MAGTFKFDLVSPERQLISDEVEQVVVPGSEGDFAVLPGHAPFLSTLRPGILEISGGGASDTRVFVRGGFAEVDPERLTVLAEKAINVKDLDADRIAAEIKTAEDDLAEAKTDDIRLAAQEAIDKLNELKASL